MKLKYLLSTIVLLSTFVYSQEQVKPCGQPEMTQELYQKHPELEAQEEQRNAELIAQGKQEGPYIAKDNPVYIIPIVFHVLHEYGAENISDQQIYDQVRILNEDFRKINADTTEIVSYFKSRAGDAKIEFRLATIDPFGNPTNGITRHYTNETNVGDNFSKLTQWPRNRYLNVWVCRSMKAGTAGYAHFPSGTEGGMRWIDGVMILNGHIGSIGTGSPYNSRSLTHEIGHYLNLYHPWGKTNDPGLPVNCFDDDAVEDTPNTMGANLHCDLTQTTCDDTLDNVQNFMDYSYCSVMFTDGQIKRMRNALVSNVGQRSDLWSQTNLDNSIPPGMIYDPVADFNTEEMACVGDAVKFDNFSWRFSDTVGANATYTWEFEDGSVATSTQENPTVSFTSAGWKTVTLTVEDNGRSNTLTKDRCIWIAPNWSPYNGTFSIDFDDSPDYFIVPNPQNLPYEWTVRDDAGTNGSGAMFLNITSPYDNPTLYSDEYFFDDRRGGTESAFITQPIDLSHVTDISISFDYACATDATTPDDMKEELWVYTSKNCGKTWNFRKKLVGSNLVNNGSGWDSFYPNSNTQWTNASFSLPNSMAGSHVFLKFVYIGSDKSNNIAIDNINVDGILSTNSYIAGESNLLTVAPNPSNSELGWNINYDAKEWGGAQIELTDIQGRSVVTGALPKNQTKLNVLPTAGATHGVYFLKITNNEKVVQKKLILE